MFPVSDVIPSRRTPAVTITLILLTAAVAAAGLTPGGAGLAIDPSRDAAHTFGWTEALSSLFAHFGWMPAAASMLCLWIFGDNIEGTMGRAPFLTFYLATSMLGVAAHVAASPGAAWPVPTGSAPIAALMAAYFVMFPRPRVLMVVVLALRLDVIEIPAVVIAGLWVLIHVLAGMAAIGQGLTSGAAFGPALAGAAAGALVGLALRRQLRWE
jgi:membrane associated rhomboid family serine protease